MRTRWARELVLFAVGLLGVLGLTVVAIRTSDGGPRHEAWSRMMAEADELAQKGRAATGTQGLTARAAYLLAFHHAQDRADVSGMLAAASRLADLGEHAMARYAREAAAYVAGSRQ